MRTIDGDLTDWTSADRLNAPGTTANGYELYSSLSGGTLTFALKAPVEIGATTTVWLDTDRSALTGYKVFGTYGGYDYNITFAADGKPYLYTDADGQTLASPTPLTYAFNADKTAVEFSLPLAQIGSAATSVNILADVNNTTFLPGDYAAGPYTVIDTATLPVVTDTSHKVGIVFSATTAAQYFSATAYSQLFMSAQNQAAAGRRALRPADRGRSHRPGQARQLRHPDLPLVPQRPRRQAHGDPGHPDDAGQELPCRPDHRRRLHDQRRDRGGAAGRLLRPHEGAARRQPRRWGERRQRRRRRGQQRQPHDGRLHRRRADPPVHQHRHLVLHQHRRPGHDARQPDRSTARPSTRFSPPRPAAATSTSPPKACWPTTTCWRTPWTGPRSPPAGRS